MRKRKGESVLGICAAQERESFTGQRLAYQFHCFIPLPVVYRARNFYEHSRCEKFSYDLAWLRRAWWLASESRSRGARARG